MTKTSTFQTVAEEVNKALVSDKRNDETTFYKFADDAPGWIEAASVSRKCHEALDDRMPDDWVYEQMYFLADHLTHYETAADAREALGEIADGMVDVYNMDRVKWLAMHLNNAFLCDDAANEFGWDKDRGLFGLIGMGQYIAIERIGDALIDCIEAEANDRDDNADDEDEIEDDND